MHKDSRLFRGQLKACSFIQSHAERAEANPLSAKAADRPASKLGIFKRLFSPRAPFVEGNTRISDHR